MARKKSEHSFGYTPLIEDEKLVVYCKDQAGKQISSITVDLDEVRPLTFEDEDFGGGKDTPHTFGDWLEYHGLWVFLSARTSSMKGPAKLQGMRDVLSQLRGGRWAKEGGGGGIAYSYLYAAIAALRTEDGKPTTYAQVAGSRKRYSDEQWEAIQAQFGDRLPKRIQALKDAVAEEDEVDLL